MSRAHWPARRGSVVALPSAPGLINESLIDARLANLFRVRMRLGHFDPPGPLQVVRSVAAHMPCPGVCHPNTPSSPSPSPLSHTLAHASAHPPQRPLLLRGGCTCSRGLRAGQRADQERRRHAAIAARRAAVGGGDRPQRQPLRGDGGLLRALEGVRGGLPGGAGCHRCGVARRARELPEGRAGRALGQHLAGK